MSTEPSLAVVLPAYNEAERIGPALDELFGYLASARRGGARRVARRRAGCRTRSRSSSSTTGAPTRPRRSSRRDPRPTAAGPTAPRWPPPRAPRRQGRGGPGRDAGRDRRSRRLRRRGHGDAARPAPAARRGAGRPRRRARLADPARRLGHADEPAALPARPGRVFHALASAWAAGPVQDTQCGFKGFTPRRGARPVRGQVIRSIVFDVELIYLARRRGYDIAIVPVHWYDRRGSRMRPRPGLALTVAWDLFRIPLVHRGVRRVATRPDARRLSGGTRPGGAARPRDRRLRRSHRRHPGDGGQRPGATTTRPTRTPRSGCSTVSRCTTRRSTSPAGSRSTSTRRRSRSPSCRSRCSATRPGSTRGRRCSSAARSRRVALMPVSVPLRWIDVAARRAVDWPFLYSVKLGQVGPILLLLFVLGWRWLERPVAPGRHDRDRDADQGPAGAARRVGGADRPAAGRCGRRGRGPGRRGRDTAAGGPGCLVRLRHVAAHRQRARDDAAQLHGRCGPLPGGCRRRGSRRSSSGASWSARSSRVVVAARRLPPTRASWWRSSPPSSSRRCCGTTTRSCSLVPAAWLLARGAWWALAIPLATSLPLVSFLPAAIYPIGLRGRAARAVHDAAWRDRAPAARRWAHELATPAGRDRAGRSSPSPRSCTGCAPASSMPGGATSTTWPTRSSTAGRGSPPGPDRTTSSSSPGATTCRSRRSRRSPRCRSSR